MPASTPNRLINEKSPYLQQQAFNPVDWHLQGPEALSRAMIMSARLGRADGHVVAWIGTEAHRRQVAGDIPFAERALPLNGKPAAYVCINRSCREPLTTASALTALLANTIARQPER